MRDIYFTTFFMDGCYNHFWPLQWRIFFFPDLVKEHVFQFNYFMSTCFKNFSWYYVCSRCFTVFHNTNTPLYLFFSDRVYGLGWIIFFTYFIYCWLLAMGFFVRLFLKKILFFDALSNISDLCWYLCFHVHLWLCAWSFLVLL